MHGIVGLAAFDHFFGGRNTVGFTYCRHLLSAASDANKTRIEIAEVGTQNRSGVTFWINRDKHHLQLIGIRPE